ncbi:tetratricopeptide repeat protein [Actinoplanes sp. NPDC051494]|uniref:tetratricopeptide repeat protein n=1 Tax=Actinoplanes sp. NPDC051494 TaxID=3363907 RepID=UPI0037A29998
MSSEPTSQSEPETTPEEYRQRALLLADLGRYDEATGELAAGLTAAPADPRLLTTLARVHVAAAQPVEALTAADRASASAPEAIEPMVVRAMALTDDRRYAEAARVAGEILTRWPEDPVAQRTGAALLSESRNGQEALNAAWNGVRLTPREAEAHLVLSVVAARLRLFDLAQRAYGEALELEPTIADAQRDVGIVRLERRRWALALESLADEATLGPQAPDQMAPGDRLPAGDKADDQLGDGRPGDGRPGDGRPGDDRLGDGRLGDGPLDDDRVGDERLGDPRRGDGQSGGGRSGDGRSGGGRSGDGRLGAERAGRGRAEKKPPAEPSGGGFAISRPAGSVLDTSGAVAHAVRQATLYVSNGVVVAAVLSAVMTLASPGVARMWAGVMGVTVLVAVGAWLARQVRPRSLGAALTLVRRTDRRLAFAGTAAAIAPLLLVTHALVGGLVALIAALVVAAVAELVILTQRA